MTKMIKKFKKMENQERFMIANRIQTPDGTILWSRYRHDYVAYDDASGEQ